MAEYLLVFLADRVRALETESKADPVATAHLAENHRHWARTLLGAQNNVIALDGARTAWLKARRRRTAGEVTLQGSCANTPYPCTWTRKSAMRS